MLDTLALLDALDQLHTALEEAKLPLPDLLMPATTFAALQAEPGLLEPMPNPPFRRDMTGNLAGFTVYVKPDLEA